MNLDDLLGSMHDDRAKVTLALQQRIIAQRDARHAASKTLIATLQEHIRELKEQEHLLLPSGGMPDVNRRERQTVERERREKEVSLALEEIQFLRDLQASFSYDLHLTREELEETARYERLRGALYDV